MNTNYKGVDIICENSNYHNIVYMIDYCLENEEAKKLRKATFHGGVVTLEWESIPSRLLKIEANRGGFDVEDDWYAIVNLHYDYFATTHGKINLMNLSPARIITRQTRYEVCSRQKWSCNMCGIKLRYNKNSDIKGELAYIDHIYPYSKAETYSNGASSINESENLQALCFSCNSKKGNKLIA